MSLQIKLIVVSLGILVLAQSLSFLLSLSSFEKIYSASLISTYEVEGKYLQQNIEASLRLGKPLSGLEKVVGDGMRRMLDLSPHVSRLQVIASDGRVLYSSQPSTVGNTLSDPLLASARDGQDRVTTALIGGYYQSLFPLHDRDGVLSGYVNLEFSRQAVLDKLGAMAAANLRALAVITGLAVLALISAMSWFVARPLRKSIASMYGLLADPCAEARPRDGRAYRGGALPAQAEEVDVGATSEEPDRGADRSITGVIRGELDELNRLRSSLDGFAAAYCSRLDTEAQLDAKCAALLGDYEQLEALEQRLRRQASEDLGGVAALLERQRGVRDGLHRLLVEVQAARAAGASALGKSHR